MKNNLTLIQVQNPTALEIPEVQALVREGCARHWMSAEALMQWARRTCETTGFFLARTGLDYQGFAAIDTPDETYPFPQLVFLYVKPRQWKVRDRLLEACLTWCRARGWKTMLTSYYKPRNAWALQRLASRVASTRQVGVIFALETGA